MIFVTHEMLKEDVAFSKHEDEEHLPTKDHPTSFDIIKLWNPLKKPKKKSHHKVDYTHESKN
jgi:hypothetical protein